MNVIRLSSADAPSYIVHVCVPMFSSVQFYNVCSNPSIINVIHLSSADVPSFIVHVCVHMFSSVQFYHVCRFVHPVTISRYRMLSSSWVTFSYLSSSYPPLPLTPDSHEAVLYVIILSFQKCYIGGRAQYSIKPIVQDWFYSLRIIPLRTVSFLSQGWRSYIIIGIIMSLPEQDYKVSKPRSYAIFL